MPRGQTAATMTRARSGTTANKSMQPWSTVLFQFGNFVGLPANNQYGFDILTYGGGSYVSVLNDAKACSQVIGWLLQQQGKLKGNIAGNSSANPIASAGLRGTATNRRKVTSSTTAATTSDATHATAPVRRGGRSRTSISRTQTPALAASANSSSGA